MVQEISIVLHYEKHADGCYYIRSDSIPGFRMAGPDFDALQRDLNPLVADLLHHNLGFEVEGIRWVPTPDDVRKHLEQPAPDGVAFYVARLKAA